MASISIKRMALACMRAPHASLQHFSFIRAWSTPSHRPRVSHGIKRSHLATALAGAIAIGFPFAKSNAMHIHVNGNQVYLTGVVDISDAYVLGDVIDRLRKQGRIIDTLVLRDSPGGSVYSGYNIADFARRNHMTTVVSGQCVSACSMMFVGGSQRVFAAEHPQDNVIGIHGMTGNNEYVDSSRDTPFYQYFLKAIVNGDPSKTDTQLLDDAFSDHGASWARIYDPAANRNPSVFWCHPHCGNPAQYKAYPNDTAYNLGFITDHAPVVMNDTLTINKNVSGNINPNYYNSLDPNARPYINYELVRFSAVDDFLAAHLAPQIKPVLTDPANEDHAYPDDIEVQLYNSLSPEERKRLLIQYKTEAYLKEETLEQFQQHLQDPESSESTSIAQISEFSSRPFVDPTVLSVGDAYNKINITNKATWTLGDGEHAAAGLLQLDTGRLHLDQGVLDIEAVYIKNGGRLEGSGLIGEPWTLLTLINSDAPEALKARTYVSDGGVIHPSGGALDFNAELQLNDTSTLALDVSPALAIEKNAGPEVVQGFQKSLSPAPLRFALNGLNGEFDDMGWLNVESGARLALNVAPGFYRPSQSYSLVGYGGNGKEEALFSARLFDAFGGYLDTRILRGKFFSHLVRSDIQGNVLDGYDIDPQQTAFHPFDNSLLSYHLTQAEDGISLVSDDAFKNPSLCGSRGCGMGDALSAAAQIPDHPLQPLLAALEFSTTSQAARAASQLRGEGYGSLRTASLSLLGNFSSTLNQHLRSVDPDADQAAQLAMAGGVTGMGLDSPRHAVDLSSMMRYLVANEDDAAAAKQPSSEVAVWGRLFGSRGHLDRDGGVAGLRQHSVGVMLGVDRQVNPETIIGGSLGYGKLRADGEDGSGFRGRIRALDMRLYVDHRYDRQYLSASLADTHLRNSATRSIDLPLFSARAKARYSGNAWSLHLEHGWNLQDKHGVLWQPILPSIDVTRLPAVQFADQGAGAAGLQVNAKRRMDPRIGVGLQVAKPFSWGSTGTLTPHARVMVQHRFITTENDFTASLQGYPEGLFNVASQQEGHNHVLANVGLSARRGTRTTFLLDYLGDFARGHRDQGVMLGLRHRW